VDSLEGGLQIGSGDASQARSERMFAIIRQNDADARHRSPLSAAVTAASLRRVVAPITLIRLDLVTRQRVEVVLSRRNLVTLLARIDAPPPAADDADGD